jgi:hypothetical protein
MFKMNNQRDQPVIFGGDFSPVTLYNLLFNSEVEELVVKATNRCVVQYTGGGGREVTQETRMQNWVNTHASETLKFCVLMI